MLSISKITVIVDEHHTSQCEMGIGFGEYVSLGTVIMEATLDRRLKCSAILDGWCSPIHQICLLIFLPDKLAAQENIACLFRQGPLVSFPIVFKRPSLKLCLDALGISSQLYELF